MDVSRSDIDGVDRPPADRTRLANLFFDGGPLLVRQNDWVGGRGQVGFEFAPLVWWLDAAPSAADPALFATRQVGLVRVPGQVVGERLHDVQTPLCLTS